MAMNDQHKMELEKENRALAKQVEELERQLKQKTHDYQVLVTEMHNRDRDKNIYSQNLVRTSMAMNNLISYVKNLHQLLNANHIAQSEQLGQTAALLKLTQPLFNADYDTIVNQMSKSQQQQQQQQQQGQQQSKS